MDLKITKSKITQSIGLKYKYAVITLNHNPKQLIISLKPLTSCLECLLLLLVFLYGAFVYDAVSSLRRYEVRFVCLFIMCLRLPSRLLCYVGSYFKLPSDICFTAPAMTSLYAD